MSSAAAAADAPEEFAALADYTIDDFMSEAASDVEIFATTEGHGDVRAEEIRFLARDPHAHDRVMSRVARLPRRAPLLVTQVRVEYSLARTIQFRGVVLSPGDASGPRRPRSGPSYV
jgi:hypothetical protein